MMNGFGFGLMGFGWILWLILIVAAVWLLVTNMNRRNQLSSSNSGETALDILKKRYAKGEITKQQFEQMKNDLNG